MIKPRSKKLLEELPKNGYKIYPSAIKAGYKPSYANSEPKKILKTALKEQAREVLATLDNKPIEGREGIKQLMHELMGITKEELLNNAKYLANQDKDLSTRLKVIAPLLKEIGIVLTDEAQKTIIPILNIGVKQNDMVEAPTLTPIDGSVELYNGDGSQNTDCAT